MNQPLPVSLVDESVAKENGRRLAVSAMLINPEAKKRVEDAYGLEYCRRVYPELYAAPSRWSRLVKNFKGHA
jgi:hypothetical protein